MKSPLEVLNKVFGYKSFRGKQEQAINHILSGKDALVLMPTGGGKSLCYQIPALCFDGVTIVVSPLIALMQDQVLALKQLGVKAEFINSSLDFKKVNDIQRSISNNEVDLVYVSPERLNKPDFMSFLKGVKISLFAIDEAHCISAWGHDFRPEYTNFSNLKEFFPFVPLIALTATADETTRGDIIKNLKLENGEVFISSFDRPNIEYKIELKDDERKQLINFISDNHNNSSGIVYCISRKRVEEISFFLSSKGLKALPYHAGLSKEEREENQNRFIKEENIIMVATIAFGMGIDKPNVRFVVHMDLPKSIESYYQETGRAGRDGLPSDAYMVYGMKDIVWLRQFIDSSEADEKQKNIEYRKLNSLIAFVETTDCRRRVLLNYFGEKREEDCKSCDNCKDAPITYDATVEMQKFLSCIYRVSQGNVRFGINHVVDVLLGGKSEKIIKFHHEELSTYGIGADISRKEWLQIAGQAVIMGFAKIDAEHQTLHLTSLATPVFNGEKKVFLRKYSLKNRKKSDSNIRQKITFSLENNQDFSETMKLFDKLKELRLFLAKTANVPPYIIFNDKTLIDMANKRPKTMTEMADIYGVGEHKLQKYGTDFLNAINL